MLLLLILLLLLLPLLLVLGVGAVCAFAGRRAKGEGLLCLSLLAKERGVVIWSMGLCVKDAIRVTAV